MGMPPVLAKSELTFSVFLIVSGGSFDDQELAFSVRRLTRRAIRTELKTKATTAWVNRARRTAVPVTYTSALV